MKENSSIFEKKKSEKVNDLINWATSTNYLHNIS